MQNKTQLRKYLDAKAKPATSMKRSNVVVKTVSRKSLNDLKRQINQNMGLNQRDPSGLLFESLCESEDSSQLS